PITLSAAFGDIDGDGWPDLAVTGPGVHTHLFWNAGDGTFTTGVPAAGVGPAMVGVGSALADLDGDGAVDWFVTGLDPCAGTTGDCARADSGDRIYRNGGGRSFTDATADAGLRDAGLGTGARAVAGDGDAAGAGDAGTGAR